MDSNFYLLYKLGVCGIEKKSVRNENDPYSLECSYMNLCYKSLLCMHIQAA